VFDRLAQGRGRLQRVVPAPPQLSPNRILVSWRPPRNLDPWMVALAEGDGWVDWSGLATTVTDFAAELGAAGDRPLSQVLADR